MTDPSELAVEPNMAEVVSTIAAAADLLDRGHLTADEFLQLKHRILNSDDHASSHDQQLTVVVGDDAKGDLHQDGQHTTSAASHPRHKARLVQLTRQMRPHQAQNAHAAADKHAEAKHEEQKAAEEATFKRMYEQTITTSRVPPMSAEQKYLFDLSGFLIVPSVLSSDECATLREFVAALHDPDAKQALPEHERYSLAGPANYLLDHPVLVGILQEIVSGENHNLDADSAGTLSGEGVTPEQMPGFLSSDDAYPFRLDGSFSQIRRAGQRGNIPHAYPRVGPLFGYQCHNRKIYSGLTRVVWELNAVGEADQGTLVVPGSHKASFVTPSSMLHHESSTMCDYCCPEGSLVLFTEALTHAGGLWSSATPRMAIFNCYGPIMAQYHRMNLPREVVEAMPPKRQTLFRGVWGHGGQPHANVYYDSETNFAW